MKMEANMGTSWGTERTILNLLPENDTEAALLSLCSERGQMQAYVQRFPDSAKPFVQLIFQKK